MRAPCGRIASWMARCRIHGCTGSCGVNGSDEGEGFDLLKTLAVANYRSILDLVVPLQRLNVITGPNGSGKSNLYRALRLLAETARDGPAGALAREGGPQPTYRAGPAGLSCGMRKRDVAVQGGP